MNLSHHLKKKLKTRQSLTNLYLKKIKYKILAGLKACYFYWNFYKSIIFYKARDFYGQVRYYRVIRIYKVIKFYEVLKTCKVMDFYKLIKIK